MYGWHDHTMIWLFLALGVLLVVGIAVYAVGSAVGRLENTALPAVLEVDDAVDWIAERLPQEAAGQLSRDDVVEVVGWYLESFAEAGLATTHGQELGDGALAEDAGDAEGRVVAPLDDALDHVVARGLERSEPLDALAVAMVADLLGTYLVAMGAIGGPAGGTAGGPLDGPGGDRADPAAPRG
jgi:hypothetical protein